MQSKNHSISPSNPILRSRTGRLPGILTRLFKVNLMA